MCRWIVRSAGTLTEARGVTAIQNLEIQSGQLATQLNTRDQDFYEPSVGFQPQSPPQSNKDSSDEAMEELSTVIIWSDEESETYPEEHEDSFTLQDGKKLIEAQIEEPTEEKGEEKFEPIENKLSDPFEEQPIVEIFLEHNPVDSFEEYLVRIADSDKHKISMYLNASPQIFIREKYEESEKGVSQQLLYLEQSPLMKLRALPTHMRYVFLGASYENANVTPRNTGTRRQTDRTVSQRSKETDKIKT